MNGSNFMHGWVALEGSLAILALILIALGLILGIVKPVDLPRHLGVIVSIVILLIMLPAIIVGLWNAMSFGQHLGIIVICAAIMLFVGSSRRRPTNARRK
jgi:hypothetical protein